MWTELPKIEKGEGLQGRILVMPVSKTEGKARDMLGNTPTEDDFYKGKPRLVEYKNKIVLAIGVENKKDAMKFGATAWLAVERTLGPVKFHIIPDFLDEKKVLEGALLSSYKFSKHFSKSVQRPWIVFHGSEAAISESKTKAKATFIARDLSNEPPNEIYPESLAERTQKLFSGTDVEVEIHNYDWLKQNGFGGIVSVGKGSENKPTLIILKYLPNGKKPILVAGKGISFDSGGINLKPTGHIETMKMDMSGAAAVIGAFYGISELKIKKDVIGIIPAAENMPSGDATRPSDVIKMYNKKTVEIWNTDAEGRVVLADALAYGIERFDPSVSIDLATLTGACVVALGERIAGLLGNSQEIIDELKAAGEKVEEETWQLPMNDHFNELLKSDVADVRNSGDKGYGGATLGAKFLENFVKGDWVHIDIAGPASSKSEWLWHSKGGTGFGVRLLIEWIDSRKS
ncbi:MAG: leucyl aminopeptidase [Candidatus Altiarchaeota archaeon]|nr:leucyl aminopeptidase [Candidatus Altiarchaeota archaeon]